MPRVSVVIPSYNRAGVLRRAMLSVLKQSYRDFDLWIADDGSEDETEVLVNRLKNASILPRIHYLQGANRGVSAARNRAIRQSSGEWIALLDSDDEWMEKKLERQLAFADSQCEYPLIHSDEIWIRNGRRVNAPPSYNKSGGNVFIQCLPLCMISPSTALFTRGVFEEIGGFDEDFPVCEDYDFWLKLSSWYPVGYVNSPLAMKYGGHPDQLSTSRPALDYWRVKSLCRILEIRALNSKQRHAVLAEIDRKSSILLKGYHKRGRKNDAQELLTLVHNAQFSSSFNS